MADSVDIILNAFDQTGPAVDSAVANVARLEGSLAIAGAKSGSSMAAIGPAIAGLVSSAATVVSTATIIAGAGLLIYSVWDELVELFESVAESIGGAFESMYETASGALSSMLAGTFDWWAAFDSVMVRVVAALAVIEFSFKNWGDVASLAGMTALYGIVVFANNVEYYFTEVIPAWLKWFGENWADVFKTIYDYTSTVVSNMYENLVRFFTAIFEWLQGDGFNFEWVSLTEGFESSIKALPEIAARELGEFEKQLGTDIEIIQRRVGEGMAETIDKRVGQYRGAAAEGNRAGFFSDWMKELFGFGPDDIGDTLSGLFGGGGKKRARGGTDSLATLSESRFLTGVTESTRDSIAASQLEEQKQTNTLLGNVTDWLGKQLPGHIRDGVKVGVQAAQTYTVAPLGS